MIDRLIAASIRHRFAVIAAGLALAAVGGLCRVDDAGRRDPGPLREPGASSSRAWEGHGPREVEDQVTYPLSLDLQGDARGEDGAVVERLRFLDDPCDLRGLGRLSRRPAAAWPSGSRGAGGCSPAGVAPQPPPDALATGQIYWYTVEGGSLDLGRLRAVAGLVRQAAAQRGAGRGRGRERRRVPGRVSGRCRSRAAPRLRGVDARRRRPRRGRGRTRRSAAT